RATTRGPTPRRRLVIASAGRRALRCAIVGGLAPPLSAAFGRAPPFGRTFAAALLRAPVRGRFIRTGPRGLGDDDRWHLARARAADERGGAGDGSNRDQHRGSGQQEGTTSVHASDDDRRRWGQRENRMRALSSPAAQMRALSSSPHRGLIGERERGDRQPPTKGNRMKFSVLAPARTVTALSKSN